MKHSVGLDVSVKETAICIVDEAGKVVREGKVATEPQVIIAFLNSAGLEYTRIGLEAGPLSQWLVNGLAEAELPVICVETRHMKAVLKAQQVNKSDRNDARGIAQMMRVGLYKPVHVKTLASQQRRMLLTGRKLLRDKLQDMENELRGTLRNFGLKARCCTGRLDGWPRVGWGGGEPSIVEGRLPCRSKPTATAGITFRSSDTRSPTGQRTMRACVPGVA
jgi:transposase